MYNKEMKCIKASSERWSGHRGGLGFERTDVASLRFLNQVEERR